MTLEQIAQKYDVKTEDILGRSREEKIIVPRHLYIYELWRSEDPPYTLEEIGEMVGGRRPATVSHAVEHAQEILRNGQVRFNSSERTRKHYLGIKNSKGAEW